MKSEEWKALIYRGVIEHGSPQHAVEWKLNHTRQYYTHIIPEGANLYKYAAFVYGIRNGQEDGLPNKHGMSSEEDWSWNWLGDKLWRASGENTKRRGRLSEMLNRIIDAGMMHYIYSPLSTMVLSWRIRRAYDFSCQVYINTILSIKLHHRKWAVIYYVEKGQHIR